MFLEKKFFTSKKNRSFFFSLNFSITFATVKAENVPPFFSKNAKVAQLVEHNLAKVRVAGSSPVFRSRHVDCRLEWWNR